MSKKKKGVDLDKVKQGVEKGVTITGIILRVVWVLIGVAALALFVYAGVKIGQALKVDFGKLFG